MEHDHSGCPECQAEVDGGDEVSVEAVQIAADAAVQIAEIEAETAEAQIEASLEHHEIEAGTEHHQIEASLEHHQIEAEASDDIEEAVEELEEAIEELEESSEPETSADEGGVAIDTLSDEGTGEAAPAVSVAPPPRVETATPKKASRQSAFTRRHSR